MPSWRPRGGISIDTYALDCQTFAARLIQSGSWAPDAPCYFTRFGCDQASAVHYGYDPAKARALLAEAGYPTGFDTELYNGNLLTSWAGAIQGNLAAVGIRAKIVTVQVVAEQIISERGDAPEHGHVGFLFDQRRLGLPTITVRNLSPLGHRRCYGRTTCSHRSTTCMRARR